VNDDVSVLQSQPPELKRQEAEIQKLLGVAQAGTFLLVTSDSDEKLLQLEESVREQLDEMIDVTTLSGYQAVSRWVPSQARQITSHSAYTDLIRTRLPGYFETLGVGVDDAEDAQAELTREMQPLSVGDWLEHPSSTQFRKFWLPAPEGERASIVLLYGVRDVAALTAAVANYPSIKVVNKARELSSLFGQYRERVAQVLAAAYLIILLGLSIRYGISRSTILMIPPVFAGLVSLIVISAAGQTLNLFNFLAMILALGIGVDFTLFIAEAKDEVKSTMFAITLSALTTMLSFGLLALSSTYAVHSFGLTVLIGIACAYLLSPLAIGARIELESK
jgi:predicted exporter